MDLNINKENNKLFVSNSFLNENDYNNNIIIHSNYSYKRNKNEMTILIDKINQFLDLQEDLKKSMNTIPTVETYILNDIENYKFEIIQYYSEIVHQIEEFKDNLSKGNEDIKKKFDLFLKEQEKFIKNNSSITEKEVELYKNLLDYYFHKEKTHENYHSLKEIISKFNLINQELIKILKDNNIKELSPIDITEVSEIEILKSKINILESHLKGKTSQMQNYQNKATKLSASRISHRSSSTGRNGENNKTLNELQHQLYSKDKEISYLNQHIFNIQTKADEEIKLIKDKIYKLQHALKRLTSEITNYSLLNNSLERENEKLMIEINILKNKKRYLSASKLSRSNEKLRNYSMKNIRSITEIDFQTKYSKTSKKFIKVNKNKFESEPNTNNNTLNYRKININKSYGSIELRNIDSENENSNFYKINSSPITENITKSNESTIKNNSKNRYNVKIGRKLLNKKK